MNNNYFNLSETQISRILSDKLSCNNAMNYGDCYGETFCNDYSCGDAHPEWFCENCKITVCGCCANKQFQGVCPLCATNTANGKKME